MDRRVKFRKGLSTLYLPYYDGLCELLTPEWQPYQGLRTFPEQDVLYAKGRSTLPIGPQHIVTKARGGQSAHNYGCATDWCLWDAHDSPHWPPLGDPLWRPYLDAVEKVGLKSGVGFRDAPHNELKLNCDWPHVYIAYQQGGMVAAQQKIEVAMVTK